ncbi:MAG: hypothetical protein K9K67_02635 [Bacteriovoracaceae bacterium]|nr:hypothetical protein [Bacteriovoracaceae bacterium]
MTDLTLNNYPIKRSFKNNESLEEVIDHLFNTEMERESVLVNLEIDNETIPFEDGLDLSKQKLNQFEKINFQTQTSTELAFEAVDSCNEYIDILSDKIREMVTLYQAGDSEKGNIEFGEMIDILDLYVQLFSKIHSTLKRKFSARLEVSEDIQKLDIHLLSVLKALIPAKEKNDIIMLCDLLEYELIDNLTQWKIKIIPSLKKLRE